MEVILAGVISLVCLFVAYRLIISARVFPHLIFSIPIISGIFCAIIGIIKLCNNDSRDDVLGVVLIGIGNITLLCSVVLIKMLFRCKKFNG